MAAYHGSIALSERFILSLKNECTRIILMPLRREPFHQELTCFANWYDQSRPHSALHGKTPCAMYHEISQACDRPRVEPRLRWPRSSPCASPHAPIAGHSGAPIRLDVPYHKGRKHLPIVALRRAAKTKRLDKSRHRQQRTASIVFPVLRCPSGGHLEASGQ